MTIQSPLSFCLTLGKPAPPQRQGRGSDGKAARPPTVAGDGKATRPPTVIGDWKATRPPTVAGDGKATRPPTVAGDGKATRPPTVAEVMGRQHSLVP